MTVKPFISNRKFKVVETILKSVIKISDPALAIRRHLSLTGDYLKVNDTIYKLSEYKNIYVVGGGKASAPMAVALEEMLGDRITTGIINVKYGYSLPPMLPNGGPDVSFGPTSKIEIVEAGHPIPDRNGLKGAKRMIQLIKGAGENDLVIALISGGASALIPLPVKGIALKDKKRVADLLLRSGATIDEINIVRKHLSMIKGGQMTVMAYPAKVISLILSDVIGDPPDIIASGPTVPDKSSYKDAKAILVRYRLWNKIPEGVRMHVQDGLAKKVAETPKEGHPAFKKVQNLIIGNNQLVVDEVERRAKEMGYNTLVLSRSIEGEAREVAKVFVAIVKEILNRDIPVKRKACIIAGGETTVKVRGNGRGGRAQEFALAGALEIAGLKGVTMVGFTTDGTDGPTDAAGAIVDSTTVDRAKRSGLDPRRSLDNNDSYSFFKSLGDLITTGPTHTNLNDLYLLFVD